MHLYNSFHSPPFPTSVGVSQGSILLPILLAMYMSPILKTYQKKMKNLNKEILTDILSFINNSLLISQEKSFDHSSVFLLYSYNIISNFLKGAGLTIKHEKSKVFHFSRAHFTPTHPIDLTSVIRDPKRK